MIELTGGHTPAMKGNNHAGRFGCVVVGSNYGSYSGWFREIIYRDF
jgi:hypothetical protein